MVMLAQPEPTTGPIPVVPASPPVADPGPVARLVRRWLGWPNPFKTVTMAVDTQDHLMIIWREPVVNAVDWDIADAVMCKITGRPDPLRSYREPVRASIIRSVTEYEIYMVDSAATALRDHLERGG